MKVSSPLWLQKCTNDNYYCKCKICKSAIDHANYLADSQMIDEVLLKNKAKKELEANKWKRKSKYPQVLSAELLANGIIE